MTYRKNEDVWAVAMFDVPTTTARSRSEYQTLRGAMLQMGMFMLQFSVYARYLPSGTSASLLVAAIESACPTDGRVTVFLISDREYSRAFRFIGEGYSENRGPDPQAPEQLTIF